MNLADIDLLEDLTDASLKFVPMYEQTLSQIENGLYAPLKTGVEFGA